MTKKYALQSTPSGWQFAHETALENFVWDHLEPLFGYQPLRRQHHVDGNYCDILAIAPSRQLVIIELKNSEDRYVVQQLTRYHHKLQQAQPFSDRVDYSQPILLIVLSPQLHEDNAIDVLYHQLNFTLISFSIPTNSNGSHIFKATNCDSKAVFEVPINSWLEPEAKDNPVPPAPRTFRTTLSKCESHDPDLILNFREKIFSLDNRIKEVRVKGPYFVYGKGKTKPVASIAFTSNKWGNRVVHQPHISFWLPISIHWSHKKERLSPLLMNELILPLERDSDAEQSELKSILSQRLFKKKSPTSFYVSEQWTVHKYLSDFIEKELMENINYQDMDGLTSKTARYCSLNSLPNPLESHENCRDFFMQLALQYWQKRL